MPVSPIGAARDWCLPTGSKAQLRTASEPSQKSMYLSGFPSDDSLAAASFAGEGAFVEGGTLGLGTLLSRATTELGFQTVEGVSEQSVASDTGEIATQIATFRPVRTRFVLRIGPEPSSFGSEGRGFEPPRARQIPSWATGLGWPGVAPGGPPIAPPIAPPQVSQPR